MGINWPITPFACVSQCYYIFNLKNVSIYNNIDNNALTLSKSIIDSLSLTYYGYNRLRE